MKYHALFVIFEKKRHFLNCCQLQIIGGALRVKLNCRDGSFAFPCGCRFKCMIPSNCQMTGTPGSTYENYMLFGHGFEFEILKMSLICLSAAQPNKMHSLMHMHGFYIK